MQATQLAMSAEQHIVVSGAPDVVSQCGAHIETLAQCALTLLYAQFGFVTWTVVGALALPLPSPANGLASHCSWTTYSSQSLLFMRAEVSSACMQTLQTSNVEGCVGCHVGAIVGGSVFVVSMAVTSSDVFSAHAPLPVLEPTADGVHLHHSPLIVHWCFFVAQSHMSTAPVPVEEVVRVAQLPPAVHSQIDAMASCVHFVASEIHEHVLAPNAVIGLNAGIEVTFFSASTSAPAIDVLTSFTS